MAFVRHIDPVESMKIGRREDAIQVTGVRFKMQGAEILPEDPEFIFNFLKRIEHLDFSDPLFKPRFIRLTHVVEVEDKTFAFLAALSTSGVVPTHKEDVRIRKELRDIRLKDFEGKTIIFRGQFLLMPTIQQIFEKLPWLIEDEEREDERIMNEHIRVEEMNRAMMKMLDAEVDSQKEIQAKKREAEMARQEIIKNATFKIKSNNWKAILPF